VIKRVVIFFLVFISLAVQARPVSYTGGKTLMQMNNADYSSLHAHYSPTYLYSLGYLYENWRDEEWVLHAVQFNRLVKRWNHRAAQANLYVKSGLGFFDSYASNPPQNHGVGGFAGIAADWENRRFFVSYENRYRNVDSLARFFIQRARIGIAPYIADYGDLHTWLMLRVDHRPTQRDSARVTALLRLFKGDYLTEIGVDEDGHALFNWVIQF